MIEVIWTEDLKSRTYEDALTIRYQVFVDEQQVPAELELDELEAASLHAVLYQAEKAIATARIYELKENLYKVQRVAVLKEFRNKGIGRLLMEELEKKVRLENGIQLTLGSQNTAIPFYEKLGYNISSDEFMDAGIPHHMMTKYLN